MVIPKLRAGCSRVTHPFAARVPRRAFPLDLHVLSTPPAFVLSQDQTLQQKPGKIFTQQSKKLPEKTNNLLGTGLSNTLLSSQETSAHRNRPLIARDPAPGATPLLYPTDPTPSRTLSRSGVASRSDPTRRHAPMTGASCSGGGLPATRPIRCASAGDPPGSL